MRSDRALSAFALVSFVSCLLLPVSNPDIFWHLSAARRMWELRAVPSADWLSSTKPGSPWIDFEWLFELICGALHRWGAMPALWAFKMFLLSAAAWILWKTLALYETPVSYRAGALALWSAASLTRSDIRPELFSVAGFAGTFWALEARRLGRRHSAIWVVPLYCLWANLHAGYVMGILLAGFYAAGEIWRTRSARLFGPVLLGAGAGALIQPSGWGAYRIFWRHWQDMRAMESVITEWQGLRLGNPWHWPEWVLILLGIGCLGAFARRAARRGIGVEWESAAALVFCGVLAWRHSRMAGYYAALVLPLAASWGIEEGWLRRAPENRSRWAAGFTCALCAAYVIGLGKGYGLGTRVFDNRFVPVQTARYLRQESAVLSGHSLYNPWGWGGYLGWRLYPSFRVFQDGRYIFHELLTEASAAVAEPRRWGDFLDRRRADVALLEDIPLRLNTTKRYSDGSMKPFRRPYYVLYMPKKTWALIHWDERALVFVRRTAAPAAWIQAHEYRYARPFDDDALREALRLGEVPAAAVEAEFKRHDAESTALSSVPPPF